MMLTAAVGLMAAAGGTIDPKHAKNITIYHVNPLHLGSIPLNMDTGDAVGDLFFDLVVEVLEPITCIHDPTGLECKNQEVVARDLAVNKLTLEVDSRYSSYAMCNIGVNGTDGWGHPCKDGTYCCVCRSPSNFSVSVPCGRTPGRENPTTLPSTKKYKHCTDEDPVYRCYQGHCADKFNDTELWWYSTLKDGYCEDAAEGQPCTWRVVSVDKVVNRTCHSDRFMSSIEARDRACFSECGPVRNISSACWVDCFYSVVLGPDSGRPGGEITGLPMPQLVDAWTTAFKDEAAGGCPGI